MQGKKRSIILIEECILACLVLIILSMCTSASDNVETEIDFEFIDGTHLNVDVNAVVNSITLPANGVTYSKAEIHSLSLNNPEMMGAIKISVKGLILDQLKESFPHTKITSLQELPSYSSDSFFDSYTLELLPSFFSLNISKDVNALVNGFLDCGAFVNYEFTLKSYTGWNQSYIFSLPPTIDYKRTNGNVNQNRVSWDITTRGEAAEKDAQMTLLYPNPTSQYTENASMQVQIILNLKQIEKPVLTLQFQALSIDVYDYNITPAFISNVKVLPSDAIRLSVLQNLTSWTFIQNQIINPAYTHVKSLIENSSFNQTIYSKFNWVNETTYDLKQPYNTSHMDMIPPISANFTDNSFHISICNISARAFFGLINAGALTNISNQDITIGDNLDSLHYPYNGTFLFPSFILLNNENKFNWNSKNPIQGIFSSSNAPQSKKIDIKSEFEIDVKNTDLNLLSFFTGKTELSMGLYLKETQNRYTTQLPESFTLPKNIKIPLLPSDAFRVCVEEKVFTEKQINEFLNLNKELFHNQLNTIFPLIKGESHLDKTIFEESLTWDKNISLMDNNTPITISSSIHTSFPLLFDFSIFPPAVSIQTLNLSFHGIPSQNVNYSMIFPKGISIKVEDELDRVLIQEQDNGRIGFTLSFNASEQGKINRVLCTIQPSALYILGMFMPCIMSIIITIVLFLIVFFIRNRRKTIPPSHPETPPQDDNEEYYIPPPPSIRK